VVRWTASPGCPGRPAVDNHVHRPTQLGTSVLITGTWSNTRSLRA
jgi:hypothetical protein